MKRCCLLSLFVLLVVFRMDAQHVIYANLKELVEERGDTLSTLKIEKRSKNQILLMGGADYRISVDKNPGLCRYLKSRCYAVQSDSAFLCQLQKGTLQAVPFWRLVCSCDVGTGQDILLRATCRLGGGKYYAASRRYAIGW